MHKTNATGIKLNCDTAALIRMSFHIAEERNNEKRKVILEHHQREGRLKRLQRRLRFFLLSLFY